MGGSPCQGFSLAGKQLNFEDPRSKLFFEFVRLLKECSPTHFLLENVSMKKEHRDVISDYLKTLPIKINSSLVSAQSRNRLYWTNIQNIKPPNDKQLYLNDIIEIKQGNNESFNISNDEIRHQVEILLGNSKYKNTFKFKRDTLNRVLIMRPDNLKIQRIGRIAFKDHKTEILTVLTQPHIYDGKIIRKVTQIEAERLQTVPDNYTNHVSNSQRYRMLGNGWTVDVIAHIFKNIEEQK